MKSKMTLRLVLFVAFWTFGASAYTANSVVVYWNNVTLEAVRDEHTGPPQAARALAMIHTCAYNAWAAHDPVARSTFPNSALRRPASEATAQNKKKAISYAAYRCLADLFPRNQASLRKKLAALGYDPDDNSTDLSSPSGIGNVAAQEVLRACHHDGANQLGDLAPGDYQDYTSYKPVNGPDRLTDPDHWQPLRVVDRGQLMIQGFVTPFWSRVIPFALTSADEFRPGPPYSWEHTRDEYLGQASELIDISAHLTDKQKAISEYWADGPGSETPVGHWCRLAQYVSSRDHLDLDADVKLFFALTNALFDASIAIWDAKRAYDSVRPITAIHFLFSGKKIHAWAGPFHGAGEIDGAEWRPYQKANVVTPAFPEYVSGHSTFSAAAAEVLRLFTGNDVFGDSVQIMAGSSRIEPGRVPSRDLVLSWPTFTDAADEAGVSRRYGGIHFRMGDLKGRRLGRLVGAQAYKKAVEYFAGSQGPPGRRQELGASPTSR